MGKKKLDVRANLDFVLINDSAIFDDKDYCTGTPHIALPDLSIDDCGDLTLWSHTHSFGDLSGWSLSGDVFFLKGQSRFKLSSGKQMRFDRGVFVGLATIREDFTYEGVRYLTDLTNDPIPLRVINIPNVSVIRHEVEWNYARYGVETYFSWKGDQGRARRVRLEGSIVPLGTFSLDDSHFLRDDLGPVPNIINRSSSASGYQLEGNFEYQLKEYPGTLLFAGYRLRRLTAQGTTRFGSDFDPAFPGSYRSTRSGLVVGLSYLY